MYYLGEEYNCPGCKKKMRYSYGIFSCKHCEVEFLIPIYLLDLKANVPGELRHKKKVVFRGTFKECCFAFRLPAFI
jgi:ribosomal protein L37AE/L43A